MKKLFIRSTLVALAIVTLLLVTGILPIMQATLVGVGIQLIAFALAAPCPALFTSVLTPEQLAEFEGIMKQIGGGWEKIKALPEQLKTQETIMAQLRSDLDTYRKAQLAAKTLRVRQPGQISDDCARFLGGLYLATAIRQEKCAPDRIDRFSGLAKDILGEQFKTALTSSDIPLPVEYSGEVVELVGEYGLARRFGTVMPLGAGSVKLPRLKTDPTFTLLAQSTAITQKSPQTEFVTFNAEKFGGLVLLPSEIDEDSIVPMGQFLARYGARNMARAEDHNFFVGTGAASGVNGTAEGLTKAVVTNSKTAVTGTLGSPSEMTIAHLRAVRAVPDAAAIRMGAYYMHPTFEQLLATYNTSGNKPYNPSAQIAGTGSQPFITGPTFDGFPIRWVDTMPVYTAADALSTVHVLFGDASFQYLGVRGGIRFQTSLEAGFATDDIYVRMLERFTVGLMATGAVAGVITHSA